MRNFILAASALLTIVCLQTSLAKDCKKHCKICTSSVKCAPGVNLVSDECGCCKTCAKQLHESCDLENPCDHNKSLYCSFRDVDESSGICVAKPGRSCFLHTEVYLSGESFNRGCKFACTCIDSDIGCAPLCPTRPEIPRDCNHPRLITKPGRCCEEWICDKVQSKPKHLLLRRRLQSMEIQHGFDLNKPLRLSAARRRPEISLALRAGKECVLQTTQWSPCASTCGWGVSERVTNDNEDCRMKKETRLCQIRPCGGRSIEKIKKGKKCVRTTKTSKPVRYSFSGCRSRVYTPKYCGQCTDGRCCSPSRTRTAKVTFRCNDGRSFKKMMMHIQSCSCHNDCANTSNNILHSYRGVGVAGITKND